MAKKSAAKIDKLLSRSIDRLLRQVMSDETGEDGKPLYTLTDKMKVIDRKLKLAAIEAKMDDAGYGTGFTQPEEENDDAD